MEQMKQITISFSIAEFLHSIFDSTPMRTLEEIDMCLRCHPATKELMESFHTRRKAMFEEYSVPMPKGNVGKGGGKVKKGDMVMQIPDDKKDEYQEKFLALANEEVELVLPAAFIDKLLKEWITPEWLISRIERFNTANGIDSITHQKVLMQCRYALEDAKDYTPTGGEEAAA